MLLKELVYQTAYCPESFLCLQEVLHEQLVDILADLNKADEWAYLGVGRNDGHEAGEYSIILYRPKIFELLQRDYVWLSQTPDKPSKGWDAGSIRILTIGVFRHLRTGQKIVAMSTHLDERGPRSRLESAKIILRRIISYVGQDMKNPVFLAGDFNSET